MMFNSCSFRCDQLDRLALSAILLVALFSARVEAHDRARTPVKIPDIPGFLTLKCDFHIHTVFSDGKVWPDIRVEEAWREGLDAIAITDHIEYQPHKADLSTNHNRSFEIAKPHGDELQVIVIRGSEITRGMPPGHFNAIFLTNSQLLATAKWQDSIKAAHDQGAFIIWNHPGWVGQQADGVPRWYDEHTQLLEQGMLHGMEVANGREFYPGVIRWCLEKNLTIFANSDIHAPLNLDFDVHLGDRRPLTLVFARERTTESIREALDARRTAAFCSNRLIGREQHVRPIFERSIRIVNPRLPVRPGGRVFAQIQNDSDLRYELELKEKVEGVSLPAKLALPAGRTALMEVRVPEKAAAGPRQVRAHYKVKNVLVGPDQPLEVELNLQFQVSGK
jgi:3',5'-nucleoside bisphosphate phosphatase